MVRAFSPQAGIARPHEIAAGLRDPTATAPYNYLLLISQPRGYRDRRQPGAPLSAKYDHHFNHMLRPAKINDQTSPLLFSIHPGRLDEPIAIFAPHGGKLNCAGCLRPKFNDKFDPSLMLSDHRAGRCDRLPPDRLRRNMPAGGD